MRADDGSTEPKMVLQRYLGWAREALVWKVEGASEYDVRRPLTPTGTNLLGLVKHLACAEAWYFGTCFDRPWPEPMPWWDDDAEHNADMYATADESREEIMARYARVTEHADATIESLPLDAPGRVPWWGDSADVTLHQMLVHVIAETNRHAGHADILREQVDGRAGMRAEHSNLPEQDEAERTAYVALVEAAARAASARATAGPVDS